MQAIDIFNSQKSHPYITAHNISITTAEWIKININNQYKGCSNHYNYYGHQTLVNDTLSAIKNILNMKSDDGYTQYNSLQRNSPQNVCPCSDPSLCKPLSTPHPEREMFLFTVSPLTTIFDWSKGITTISAFGPLNQEFVCLCHSHGVRVTFEGQFSPDKLQNITARSEWVQQMVSQAQQFGLDGINIDFETYIGINDSANRNALVALAKETTKAFHAVNPVSQVTFDVPARVTLYEHYYEYIGLAKAVDFLVLMDYDTSIAPMGGTVYIYTYIYIYKYICLCVYLLSKIYIYI